MASIVRDEDGLPISFGAPLEIVSASSSPISVSWSDENTIAVLHSLGDGTTSASLHTVGGTVRDLGILESGRNLEARANVSAIYAIDSRRTLYAFRNISWTTLFDEVLALHFTN